MQACTVLLFRVTNLMNGEKIHSSLSSYKLSFERFLAFDILDISLQDKVPCVVEKVGFGVRQLVFEFWSISEVYDLWQPNCATINLFVK